MRLVATVIEGDQERSHPVPLITVMSFAGAHEGRTLNDAIGNGDFTDWEPWVVWHTMTSRCGETRDFDEWVQGVDWAEISQSNDADPFGGEPNPTGDGSPKSSSPRGARGRSS